MRKFYTSDLHFGHQNIIKYSGRPYGSVEEMNEALIENWNNVVRPDDDVWVLGDVAMGKIAESLPLCKRLNGTKFLVPGNHDRCWVGNKKWTTGQKMYADAGFNIVAPTIVSSIGKKNFLMCHFPYEGDSHDADRYTEHRPKDFGLPIVHGHVHEKWRVNGRQFNVGVDVNNYTPVHVDVIAEWLDTL